MEFPENGGAEAHGAKGGGQSGPEGVEAVPDGGDDEVGDEGTREVVAGAVNGAVEGAQDGAAVEEEVVADECRGRD